MPIIESTLNSYDRGRVEIRVVPNVGRDIGPLLTAFGGTILAGYDLFGHLHTKRSLVLGDPRVGENWRNFCREHLLGRQHPMMDLILKSFSDDPKLGLVLPSDPNLWPVGQTEAWSIWPAGSVERPHSAAAVLPARDDVLGENGCARAPIRARIGLGRLSPGTLPYDGTVLHAIERLVTLLAGHQGFTLAATHVPGIGR